MKPACPTRCLALAFLFVALAAPAQSITQTITLRPGWNAVWIEVDPPSRDPASVFAGLPLVSAWTWSDRVSATDFLQNPRDTGWNRAQWLSYFPPESPEAGLSTLGSVVPQRAYLVRLSGTEPVEWSVSGKPVLRTPAWSPDRYNLRGFPVDRAAPPTFGAFFRSSPAHFDAAQARMESVFRLAPDGQWREAVPTDVMRRGEAFWVFTRGASDFVAPFHLELNTGDVINFDSLNRQVAVTFRNRALLAKVIRIEPATGHASPLLLHSPASAHSTNGPTPIATHDQLLPPSGLHQLKVGVDRTLLSASPATDPASGLHTNVLRVDDDEGTTFFVGVTALAGPASDFTGLWLGTATIDHVGAVSDTTNVVSDPGTVPAAFPLRLLLHFASDGHVTLLRDVTLIYTATNTLDAAASGLASRPTRLVTDPAILAALPADDVRPRRVTGRRLTAPHFDFARIPGQFEFPLTGVFALSNQLTGTLEVPADLPTNRTTPITEPTAPTR